MTGTAKAVFQTIRQRWHVVNAVVLIVVIPALVGANVRLVVQGFKNNFDVALQRHAVVLADFFNVAMRDQLSDPAALQTAVGQLASRIPELRGIEVRVPAEGGFRTVASTNPARIGQVSERTSESIAWSSREPIAYLSQTADVEKEQIVVGPRFGERFWNVVAPLTVSGAEQPVALLHLLLSLEFVDRLVDATLYRATLWLAVTVGAVLILLGTNLRILVDLRRANRQLVGLDELKSKFISVVSHQVRTPLTEIRWHLESLISGELGKLSRDQEQSLRHSYEGTAEIVGVVHDLLTALDIEKGEVRLERERTVLPNLVASVTEEFRPPASVKRLSLSFEPPARKVPELSLDPRRIRLVITKILSNAVIYTPEGGSVRVSVVPRKHEVVVSVADTGKGIPQDEQERIFGRFYRGSNAALIHPDGLGLGLYLAKHFVEAHGGRVWFVSKEGRGTTFSFSIPVAAPEE